MAMKSTLRKWVIIEFFKHQTLHTLQRQSILRMQHWNFEKWEQTYYVLDPSHKSWIYRTAANSEDRSCFKDTEKYQFYGKSATPLEESQHARGRSQDSAGILRHVRRNGATGRAKLDKRSETRGASRFRPKAYRIFVSHNHKVEGSETNGPANFLRSGHPESCAGLGDEGLAKLGPRNPSSNFA